MRTTLKTILTSILSLTLFCGFGLLFLEKYPIEKLSREEVVEKTEESKEIKEPVAPASLEKISENAAKTLKNLKEVRSPTSTLILESKNTLTLRGAVTAASMAKLSFELQKMSSNLSNSDVIYLVMDTPGGSVIDGNQFIDLAKSIPQQIKTVTIFSASMGFQIVQNLGERMITPNGTLMSHRARGGFEGEFGGDGKGELISQLNWILEILKRSDEIAAAKMQMKVEDYQELIRDEFWTTGDNALKTRAADKVVNVRCGKSLIDGVEKQTVRSFFGKVELTYSKCPTISYPLEVNMSLNKEATPAEIKKVKDFTDKLINDKRGFVKTYIKTGEFEKIVK